MHPSDLNANFALKSKKALNYYINAKNRYNIINSFQKLNILKLFLCKDCGKIIDKEKSKPYLQFCTRHIVKY